MTEPTQSNSRRRTSVIALIAIGLATVFVAGCTAGAGGGAPPVQRGS